MTVCCMYEGFFEFELLIWFFDVVGNISALCTNLEGQSQGQAMPTKSVEGQEVISNEGSAF
jgi:hypothetical protein